MEPTLAALDRFEDSKDILNAIKRAFHDATHEIGTVNVLIAGRTGVGKSTLINEIFQGRLAETGQGMPITKETRRLTKKGIPLAIYDTRGLELKEYQQIIEELVEFARAQARDTDGYQHIHVAWLCVAEDGRRVGGGRGRAASTVGGTHAGARRDHQGARRSGIPGRGAAAPARGQERGARARVERAFRRLRRGASADGAGGASGTPRPR